MEEEEPRLPDYVYSNLGGTFYVMYTDGTLEEYSTNGPADAATAIDCPGYLTYVRCDPPISGPGMPSLPGSYVYTYTESGVTTDTFGLFMYIDSQNI